MMGRSNKSIIFTSDLYWEKGETGVVNSHSVNHAVHVATAPEFGGKKGEWSPEHLFLSSITSCYMSTYLAFVNKLTFENIDFECSATGQVDLVDGKYKFTFIHVYPRAYVKNESDREKAELAMAKAKRYCLISNSINAEIIQHPEVIVSKNKQEKNIAPIVK